jgi:hypothetical protein
LPAVSTETLASSAASPDGYSRIHQCISKSHCCRVSREFSKKLPFLGVKVTVFGQAGHLHLHVCNYYYHVFIDNEFVYHIKFVDVLCTLIVNNIYL